MGHKIEYYFASHVGKCRKVNQDNFYCNGSVMHHVNRGTGGVRKGSVDCRENPIFAVFDGMGGEEQGEMAAYLAAKEMEDFSFEGSFDREFFDFCTAANREICEYTQKNGISSMGTTAAILGFTEEGSCLCNIGDSKVFLFSEDLLTQISYDHVGIAVFGKKPPLSQNLGIPEDEMIIEHYVANGGCQAGNVYLICSDGLTDMVTQERIQAILTEFTGREAAKQLLEEALRNGGRDNITLILLYVSKQKRSLLGFLKR